MHARVPPPFRVAVFAVAALLVVRRLRCKNGKKCGDMGLSWLCCCCMAREERATADQDLLLAAQSGDVDQVSTLATATTVNLEDDRGVTALHAAVIGNQPAIVELLLARGADVHQRSANGRTALHNACARSSPAAVELLLDAGSDLNCSAPADDADGTSLTPLDFALDWNRVDIADLLRARGAKTARPRS